MTKQPPTFNIGDKVLRKADTNFVLIGEVVRREGSRLRVAWPDERRIGGNGLYHTSVKPGSLIPATDEAIKRRKIKWYQSRIAHEERLEQCRYCSSCKRQISDDGACTYCGGAESYQHVSKDLPRYRQVLAELTN